MSTTEINSVIASMMVLSNLTLNWEIASSGKAAKRPRNDGLNELDPPRGKYDHAQQQQSVFPTGDIC